MSTPPSPLPFHVLSAFSPVPGTGSQAALINYPSNADPRWLDDKYLLKVAGDFNYTATVHVAPTGQKGEWAIRWFTPKSELALCGHGTLSSSYILLKQHPELDTIQYINLIAGKFQSVRLSASDKEVQISLPSLPFDVIQSMGHGSPRSHHDTVKLIAALEGIWELRELGVDIRALGEIASGQIIITQISPETDSDLVIKSRMFAPGIGIQEDTIFLPTRLQQDPTSLVIHATQLSERGGGMKCILGEGGETVRLIGKVREFGNGYLVDDDDDVD
ncbi:hypothetical protein I203_106348 [Kwoniella mangroviensis CBS 8507]|uniref:uncharacterized protein n=1 Tax=Kwoniella mangroviensis CBS 8507 TaxID=1296122 RepID=UPI00305BC4AF